MTRTYELYQIINAQDRMNSHRLEFMRSFDLKREALEYLETEVKRYPDSQRRYTVLPVYILQG